MKATKYQFMRGVLGEEGAKALAKAAERSTSLENALLPRTIIAWLGIAARSDVFEGELPGVPNTYLQFNKSEEDRYSGSIGIEGEVYSFNNASVFHVASSVAVALGLDHEPVDERIRPSDLAKLGKTIDTLTKAHVLIDNLKKVEPPGPAAAPQPPGQPTQPTSPTKQPKAKKPPTLPGMPKLPAVKVTKSESEVACRDCGRTQFVAGRFTGCYCFMALAKSVKATQVGEDFSLEFKGDWDREAVAILLKSMGK